jgi:hypothetical protein
MLCDEGYYGLVPLIVLYIKSVRNSHQRIYHIFPIEKGDYLNRIVTISGPLSEIRRTAPDFVTARKSKAWIVAEQQKYVW